MNAPVWYLFDRLSSITGGTGWYRSYLIGQAVQHFNEWWLCGTTFTAHWVPWGDLPLPGEPNMADITNHYIMEGVRGGVLRLGFFILLIVQAFRAVGRQLRAGDTEAGNAFLAWAFGVSLFGHCISFMSVHYFDQTMLVWFWVLACISASGPAATQTRDSLELGSEVGSADSTTTGFVEVATRSAATPQRC
jgi:hypothetical protein